MVLYRILHNRSFLLTGFPFGLTWTFFDHIGMLIVVELYLLLLIMRALVGCIIQVGCAAGSGRNGIYRCFFSRT